MTAIEKANKFIKEGKVRYVSGNQYSQIWEVGNQIVKIIKKNGRLIDSCSCPNHSRFCNENPRCSHKLAVSTYIVMRNFCQDCGDSINNVQMVKPIIVPLNTDNPKEIKKLKKQWENTYNKIK